MTSSMKLYAAALCLLLSFASGLGLGWKLWRDATQTIVKEVPAPQIVLPNGGMVLEKKVASHPTIKQELPAGAKIEEEGTIRLEEHERPSTPSGDASRPAQGGEGDGKVPHVITINFAVARLPDGSRRVVASSPDGVVVGGVDIVVDPPKPSPPPLRNSAGLVYGTTAWGDTAKGIYYDRDWKLFRAGAELTRNTYAMASRAGWEARVKFGMNF